MNQTIEVMKKLGNDKIAIEDCSSSTGNKTNLLRMSILGQTKSDSCSIMKAICTIEKICNIADERRYDLVIDLAGRQRDQEIEILYKQIGFRYASNGHEMMRRYNKQNFLTYKIKVLLARAKG
ncbi:MAG: hypothetical protein H6Q70_2071 [Firmicutes bacterium]|nr:hypothetical protein [Bacillota bacterium]